VLVRVQLISLCKLKRWEDGVRFCEKYWAPPRSEPLGGSLDSDEAQVRSVARGAALAFSAYSHFVQ
jgi:hypothetical protein